MIFPCWLADFYAKRYRKRIFIQQKNNGNLSGTQLTHISLIFQILKRKEQCELIWVDLDTNVLIYLEKIGIKGLNMDISNNILPVKDESIDIIIFNEVIEHLFDCQHALDEIYRILKKGGKLYISTHNSFNIFMRLKFLLGKIPTPSLDVSCETMGEHIRLFNKKLLIKLLLRAWFKKSNIINKSRFKLGKVSFYTKKLTGLLARHLYFIASK